MPTASIAQQTDKHANTIVSPSDAGCFVNMVTSSATSLGGAHTSMMTAFDTPTV